MFLCIISYMNNSTEVDSNNCCYLFRFLEKCLNISTSVLNSLVPKVITAKCHMLMQGFYLLNTS